MVFQSPMISETERNGKKRKQERKEGTTKNGIKTLKIMRKIMRKIKREGIEEKKKERHTLASCSCKNLCKAGIKRKQL